MTDVEAMAVAIKESLRAVAAPDSRFQFDTDQFIPDFTGSDAATHRFVTTGLYREADIFLVTPDNALLELRTQLIRDGKAFVYPSYGLVRGFRYYEPSAGVPSDPRLAATLDGLEQYARPITLAELGSLSPCQVAVAGASAIAANGVRFGMGYHYLDCEWPMLAASGFVGNRTPIVTIVHDCQVADRAIPAPSGHLSVNHVYTPSDTRIHHVTRPSEPPVFPAEITALPVFAEYLRLRGEGFP